jgi:Hydrazine synthase alpha subunit middle domain
MIRPRSVTSLITMAGAAALGLSGIGCGSSQASDPTGVGADALVFAKRMHTTVNGDQVSIDVAGGNGQVIDYLRYVPGGGVYVLSPARPDGQLTNLTADYPEADIAGIDLSFDAKNVLFSMKTSGDDHYHIYTENLATHEIHKKTFGDWDDINPIYVPGDRIAFVSNQSYDTLTGMDTRADEYNHGRVVTQLVVMSNEGGDADRKLCSQNLSHTVNPFLRFDGSIGYSRWEHLGGVNDVKLFRMDPDCTKMFSVAGQFGKPSNSLVQVTEIAPNVMVGIATDRERTIQAGAIVRIDARQDKDGASPLARRLDSEHVQFDIMTPGVPVGSDNSALGRYRNPRALPDGRIIASWADLWVNDTNELTQTPPDFGLYIYDPANNAEQPNQLVYNDKNAWDLYPIALTPRDEPPAIGSVQNLVDPNTPATLGSIDVKNSDLTDNNVTTVQHYTGSGGDTSVGLLDALHGAVKVRVVEGFSSESAKGVTMFGLTMDEGAAVLGEAKVYGDGSWLANVPPYIPIHLQPIDKFGMSIRNQRLWIQGMPGESRVCGGCHENRTGDNTFGLTQNLTAAVAENFVKPIADRAEYPWDLAVQPVLTAKCAGCHNGSMNGSKAQSFYTLTKTDAATGMATAYQIPYLDLSATPVTAYYDREVHTWPASYVSIFYPATMDMMTNGYTVMGTVPPKWGVPEAARASVLIEKMNVKAADGSFAWDQASHPMHPEDVGVQLTDDERRMLITVMDLGGQYYSRKNTGFTSTATGGMYQ